ncbi:hypothetical protein CcrC1_gp329 [Caulobacter phage C1]|nr:hypothetical protein CcrC1_gp329 [Caulobacter phage C1]UTU08558.1 hypothetical protein CcrC2_gp330 [Caulobacter phage C2]UTU09074.1 hypothetical protein CcrJ4_gp325 [Caulobacter phage J4]UTU10191.1 hypothetical protein CcrRB23_gp329 [Caulobacter phage RB23]WGN97225.1 hypothetical protein [Bertelyvirus sp.]
MAEVLNVEFHVLDDVDDAVDYLTTQAAAEARAQELYEATGERHVVEQVTYYATDRVVLAAFPPYPEEDEDL